MNSNIWTKHADKVLCVIAIIMGVSYPIAKGAMDTEWGKFKFLFLSLRFLLAFLALLPWAFGSFRREFRRYAGASLLVGVSLVATYGFQYKAFTLPDATAGSVAFIMSCKVILVTGLSAFLWKAGWLKLRESPLSRNAIVGVSLTTMGLLIFTYHPGFVFQRGDLFAVCGMLGYGVFLILFSELSRRGLKPIPIVAGASFVISIMTAGLSQLTELGNGFPAVSTKIVLALLWMGLIPGAFGLLALFRVSADATRQALILSLEPVIASLVDVAILHKGFTLTRTIGAILMLAGVTAKYLMPWLMTVAPFRSRSAQSDPL